MEVTIKEFRRCAQIKATDRIDSSTAPQLAKTFESLSEANRFKIVFDMSEVDFISSAGLRVLISAQKICKRWNRGELVLASVPEKIYDVLDLAGFLPLFRFFDEVVDAVGSF
jgi:anti-sigma B factor antagonist